MARPNQTTQQSPFPLGAGVDLLELSAQDAYAFTHALPYATDFGRLPLPELLTGIIYSASPKHSP